MIGEPMRIVDAESDVSFPVESSIGLSSLDGRIPVEFDGQSGEGDIYRDHRGRLFLVRYGSENAVVVDWGY